MTEGKIFHKSQVAQSIRSFCLFKSRRKDEFHPGVSDGTVWPTPWLYELRHWSTIYPEQTFSGERKRVKKKICKKVGVSLLLCWFVIWTHLISSTSEKPIPYYQRAGVIHLAHLTAVCAEVLAVCSCCWVTEAGCCIAQNLSLTLPWVIVACTTSAQYNFLRALQNAMYLISDSHLG